MKNDLCLTQLGGIFCVFTCFSMAAFGNVGCGGDGGGGEGGTAKSGTVKVQISGEDLATTGLLFPSGSEVTIADGWELKFSHVLVTVGKVWLSENPDSTPSDQSKTGAVLVEAKGPWAVDLAKEGKEAGAAGEGTAALLTTLSDPAITVGERYAFSYNFAEASEAATSVNFEADAGATALYAEMVKQRYTLYYVGTATFKGESCESSDPTYNFSKLPQTFDFKIGLKAPVTFLNCQNQENQGEPFGGEEFQRGITIKDNEASLGQITVHLDHLLYSSLVHEPALYFDQFAAQLVGKPEASILSLEDLIGVDPSAFADAEGTPLPWRTCSNGALPPNKQRFFDTGNVTLDPNGDPSSSLRDYYDFVHYVTSTQGHMNGGEGLCYAKRDYPSPQ